MTGHYQQPAGFIVSLRIVLCESDRPATAASAGWFVPVTVPLRTGLCPVFRLLRLRLASVMRCARLQRVRSRVDTMLANIHPWVPLVGARRSPHYGG